MDVGDAAVGDPGLCAVEQPLVGGFLIHSSGSVCGHVGAGVGLGCGKGPELDVVGVAVALRHPFHDLFTGSRGGDARGRKTRSHDRHADAGVAPEQLFQSHRHRQPGPVVHHDLGHELPAVEPDLGRLFQNRPRCLLPLVPFLGRRTDHIIGKVVDPFLQLQLVFVEVEGEFTHRTSCSPVGSLRSVDRVVAWPARGPVLEGQGPYACRQRAVLHKLPIGNLAEAVETANPRSTRSTPDLRVRYSSRWVRVRGQSLTSSSSRRSTGSSSTST